MSLSLASHIVLDDRGVAWIDDSNVKVKEVVIEAIAHGLSPEEIHFQHPHLSLAQIHASLSFYHDHKTAIDDEIRADLEEVNRIRQEAGDTSGRAKLRAGGVRP